MPHEFPAAQQRGLDDRAIGLDRRAVDCKHRGKVEIVKNGKRGTKNWDNLIAANIFYKEGDSLKEVNKIRESASSMGAILYTKNSLRSKDLDNDGIIESFFFYEVEKDGLDDNTLKLICFYKKSKFVIAGNVPKQSERKGNIKYTLKGLENIPTSVASWLTNEWKLEAHKRMDKYISELE